MILQPVLNVFLLLLFFAPVAVLGVMALVKAPTGGLKGLWSMRLLMLLACFVMLLRPGIPGGATQTLATDTDIVLVVDTTSSIVAEDWNGDQPRLDGVRADIQAIVDEYPGARFALLTFDASADLRMPLTTDTTALISSLDVLRPEVTSRSKGSSIGIANQLLSDTLSSAAKSSPDRSRMVFYFGDGEQTVSSEPESFSGAKKLTDAGAVFGYGTADGGPMKLSTGGVDASADGGYIEYQGANALSKIDEGNLKAIADELGVTYEHRTADTVPTLPKAPSTTTSYTKSGEVGNVTELYWIAAVLIAVLLGVELARATMLVARLRLLKTSPPTRPSTPTRSLSEERSDETKRRPPASVPPTATRSLSDARPSTATRSLSEERSDETKRRPPASVPPTGGDS